MCAAGFAGRVTRPPPSPDYIPACPPGDHAWVRGAGALGEDVCSACQRRFFPTHEARTLFGEVLGLPDAMLRDLVREGARRIPCPACQTRMSTTWVRGVLAEICGGCGAALLDPGELARISQGQIAEFPVSPAADREAAPWGGGDEAPSPHLGRAQAAMAGALELDLSGRAPRRRQVASLEVEVRCTHCDAALDLSQVNWLVNTRPWCGPCARPYASWLAPLRQLLHLFLQPREPFWRRTRHAEDEAARRVDVLRIAPADAEQYFGPFFTLARSRAAGEGSQGTFPEGAPDERHG